MRQSFSEYIRGLLRWGWFMVIGLGAAAVGFGLDVAQTTGWTLIELPRIVWRIVWGSALAIALLVVPFLAYHKLRVERDNLRAFNKFMPGHPSAPILAESQLFISNPHGDFGHGDEDNFGGLDPSRLYAIIGAECNAQSEMAIERVALQIEGQQIPAINWYTYEVGGGQTYLFSFRIEIGPSVGTGQHLVMIVAFAGGKSWRSPEFSIDVPNH